MCSRRFIPLAHTFRSVNHFELISELYVWYKVRSTLVSAYGYPVVLVPLVGKTIISQLNSFFLLFTFQQFDYAMSGHGFFVISNTGCLTYSLLLCTFQCLQMFHPFSLGFITVFSERDKVKHAYFILPRNRSPNS